jgi:hypothetical protein
MPRSPQRIRHDPDRRGGPPLGGSPGGRSHHSSGRHSRRDRSLRQRRRHNLLHHRRRGSSSTGWDGCNGGDQSGPAEVEFSKSTTSRTVRLRRRLGHWVAPTGRSGRIRPRIERPNAGNLSRFGCRGSTGGSIRSAKARFNRPAAGGFTNANPDLDVDIATMPTIATAGLALWSTTAGVRIAVAVRTRTLSDGAHVRSEHRLDFCSDST